MRLKNDTNNYAASFNITPPYQMLVLHSKVLIYPREIYQRGVERKRVEMIAADFNEYIANEPKISFRNGKYYVVNGQHTIEGRILRNGGEDLPMHFVELYHGEFSEERLVRALGSVHPMEIYRVGRDNPAKLPGWKKYVFPIYMAYNGKGRKDALPMKF